MTLYFFIWLIMAGFSQGSARYFIYLTNWAHIAFNLYLIVAAVSISLKLYFSDKQEQLSLARQREYFGIRNPEGYWNTSNNKLSWYQMVHWVLFTIGNEGAFVILALYWSLLYRGGDVNGVNANTHLVNGLLAVVDLWVTGLPVNLIHFLYLMIFSTIYSTFAGIYYIYSGDIIYVPLDYRANAGAAVGLCLSVGFFLLPFIHSLFYLMFLCRQGLVYRVHAWRFGGSSGRGSDEHLVESICLEELREHDNDSSA